MSLICETKGQLVLTSRVRRELKKLRCSPHRTSTDVPTGRARIAIVLTGSMFDDSLVNLANGLSGLGHIVIVVAAANAQTAELKDCAVVVVDGSPVDRIPPCDVVIVGDPATLPRAYYLPWQLAVFTDSPSEFADACPSPDFLLLPDALLCASNDIPAKPPTDERWTLVRSDFSDVVGLAVSHRDDRRGRVLRPGVSCPPTVSLCVIAKNEESDLPRLLMSSYGAVDEIIVVDTGSEDNTASVAEKYGARLFHFQWCDDFSAARNYSLAQATGDWIMVADADEELTPELRAEIKRAVQSAVYEGYIMLVSNVHDVSNSQAYVFRLFRNRPQYRFEGIVHERIAERIQGRIGRLDSVLLHYGYQQSYVTDRRKRERNLKLLERQYQQSPSDGYVRYQLSREYLLTKKPDQSLILLQGLADEFPVNHLLRPLIIADQMRALFACEKAVEAVKIGLANESYFDQYPDIPLLTAIASLSLGETGLVQQLADRMEVSLGNSGRQVFDSFCGLSSVYDLRAQVAEKRHEYDSAFELYVKCCRSSPHNFSFCVRLATFVIQRVQPKEAYEILDSLGIYTAEFMVAVAYSFLAAGNLTEARLMATALDALHIRSHITADMLFAEEQFAKASLEYQAFPSPEIFLRWGISMALTGDRCGLEALGDKLHHAEIGALHCLMSQSPVSTECVDSALTIMRELLSFGLLQRCLESRFLLERNPNSALLFAKVLAEKGCTEAASQVLREAEDPLKEPWVCEFLARSFINVGDRDAAMPFMLQRISQPMCPVDLIVELAKTLMAHGDYRAALEALELGIMTYPFSLDLKDARMALLQTSQLQ